MSGLVIDLFAGGGGASEGIRRALGRDPDIAVNHDAEALAMHQANHPATQHLCGDVWEYDPIAVTGGKPVELAWFSFGGAAMIALPNDLRALSFLQPWANFVADGSKTVENRLRWKTSNFRGWFLIHASQRPPKKYYDDALDWMVARGLAHDLVSAIETKTRPLTVPILPSWLTYEGPFGGIIGIANVYSAIYPGGVTKSGLRHPNRKDPWYMGGFALYVQGARPLPFIPCKGALGFFRPPADVLTRVREEVARLA